jgi:hypothetical protein
LSDTIREYLIALGFSVDEAKFRRFQDAITGTARSAVGLGTEVVGVGSALTEMVDRVARHFEDLYYMSQRTGSTVSALDAVGFAAKQVGLSAEQAQGAVEGMAHAMRMNPGARGLAQAIGATDPQSLVERLKKQYGEGGYFVAARQAESIFGINEQVFQHYWMFGEKLKEQEQDYLKRLREAGFDADVEAKKFVEFGQVLNTLASDVGITGKIIAKEWREPVQGMLVQLDGLVQGFNRLDKSTEGYAGKVAGLVAAIGGVEMLGMIARWFGVAVPTIVEAIPAVAGGGFALNAIRELEKKNDTGRSPDWEAIGQLPWWQRMAIGTQKTLGADPNQFLPGGTHGPGRKRGNDIMNMEDYGEDHGAYNTPGVPLPQPRPFGYVTFHISQTNNIDGAQSPMATAAEIKNAHRELGDALRNLYQKIQ